MRPFKCLYFARFNMTRANFHCGEIFQKHLNAADNFTSYELNCRVEQTCDLFFCKTHVTNPKFKKIWSSQELFNISQQMLLIVGGVGYLSRMLVQMLFNQICLPVARWCCWSGRFLFGFQQRNQHKTWIRFAPLDDHPTLRT